MKEVVKYGVQVNMYNMDLNEIEYDSLEKAVSTAKEFSKAGHKATVIKKTTARVVVHEYK